MDVHLRKWWINQTMHILSFEAISYPDTIYSYWIIIIYMSEMPVGSIEQFQNLRLTWINFTPNLDK